MTLKKALSYFERLVSETDNKSEIKVYQEFIDILTGLDKRDLSETDIESVEKQLDTLGLNPGTTNKRRYFRKALQQFKDYLKETHSLITKGYYTKMGVGLGLSLGVLIGVMFLSGFERSLGISLGISIGMIIGLIIGRQMDAQALASGKMV